MINYQKDDFDGTIDEIMSSINDLLNNTGDGYETEENLEESDVIKRKTKKDDDK